MFLLQSNKLLEHISDIIHKDTQHHKFSLDLTVSQVQRFTSAGSLDFGGSEFQGATTQIIEPEKRNPDDDYGWWELDAGAYRAVFNEKLQNHKDTLSVVSAHEHTSEAGVIVSTNLITDETDAGELTVNFQAPSPGLNIKENARFATLHILAD